MSREEHSLELGDVIIRIFDFLRKSLGDEEEFLEKLFPDHSDRTNTLNSIIQPLSKIVEKSISDMVLKCCNVKTLKSCLEALQSMDQKFDDFKKLALEKVTMQYNKTVENQSISMKKALEAGNNSTEIATTTKKLADLLYDTENNELFGVWMEAIDKHVSKQSEINAIVFALKNTNYMANSVLEDYKPGLLAKIETLCTEYAESELDKMDSRIQMILTNNRVSATIANMLINSFNNNFRLWLQQFHLNVLQHFDFTKEGELIGRINEAFTQLVLKVHTGLQTAATFLISDDLDSLVPSQIVQEEIKSQINQ